MSISSRRGSSTTASSSPDSSGPNSPTKEGPLNGFRYHSASSDGLASALLEGSFARFDGPAKGSFKQNERKLNPVRRCQSMKHAATSQDRVAPNMGSYRSHRRSSNGSTNGYGIGYGLRKSCSGLNNSNEFTNYHEYNNKYKSTNSLSALNIVILDSNEFRRSEYTAC